MQDMITEQYEFTIVPLQIITKAKMANATPKSILFKLGQSVAKTRTLGTPLKLLTEVLYAKAAKKYCPVKGIIKIYDIMPDQNQIISCVGTFQTQDILQRKISKQIITKNIGSTILKMEVSAKLYVQPQRLQISPQLMKQSISEVSSQRIVQNSEGSQNLISLDDSITQQNDPARHIRRVNTLNPGQTYQRSDVVDLKSAINFGPSNSIKKQLFSGSGLSNSNHKLQMKATVLQKNNLKQIQTIEISQNRKNASSPTSKSPTKKNLYSIPRISVKSSFDQNYKQLDNDENSEIISELDLQLQSKKSNKQVDEKTKKNIKLPPTLCLPLFPKLTPNSSNCTDGSQKKITKVEQFMDDNNDDYKTSPLMITSVKHIKDDIENNDKFKKTNNMESASKYSIGSGSSNDNMGILMKSIYNLGFIPKVDSSGEIIISGNSYNNKNNNNAMSINNSNQLSMSNASVTTSVVNQYQKIELQTLGEQLIQERRKNVEYQNKIQKYHLRIITAKQKYSALLNKWDEWSYIGHRFLQNLIKDVNGQNLIEINKNKENIIMRYKVSDESENIFMNFLKLTAQNCTSHNKRQTQNKFKEGSDISQHKTRLASQMSQISNGQLNHVLQKIQQTYANNAKLLKIQQQLNEQIHNLSQNLYKSQKYLKQTEIQRKKLQQQITEYDKNIQHLNFQINSISGINVYLKQKDQQMENIISLKESTIDNMKKMLQQNNVELDQLEEQIAQCKKIAENKQLMLQEMKEELADKEEIIELYREVYGEINRYSKNKDVDASIQSCIRTFIENKRIQNNQNEINYKSGNFQVIEQQNAEESNSEVILSSHQNGIKHEGNINSNSDRKKQRRSLSIQQSVSLANSVGFSRNQNEKQDKLKEEKNSNQKSLLLAVIRNNEKIYKYSPQQVKIVQNELKLVYNKIDDYIHKLDSDQLFCSME